MTISFVLIMCLRYRIEVRVTTEQPLRPWMPVDPANHGYRPVTDDTYMRYETPAEAIESIARELPCDPQRLSPIFYRVVDERNDEVVWGGDPEP